ncbi:nucleoside-diphosphate-sugar epimerase [Histoplasma capsulatum]|uniref:Nucleoside-diphosphate-sugar epimerase n=2 Tax=Histoplasma TaxID=5036 RepID=A0A8A1LZ15_AJECA|nr:nucleoside-diphosphate-sugar epimerase [Histoplasma capsulatum]
MKLIVTGATGYVGTEVIRLALRNKAVSSVVALARRPVQVPEHVGPDADKSKLQSVILDDWTAPYPESVKEKLKGADACIWCLAVTPTKSLEMDFADVTRICSDFTINGLHNIASVANNPFRFIYISGVSVERDQTKTLWFLSDYRLMRGRIENAILDFAKQHEPAVQATVTKPAGVEGPSRPRTLAATSIFKQFGHAAWVHLSELAAAMIDQCLNGITKDPLWAEDLEEIGARVLRKEDYAGYEPEAL